MFWSPISGRFPGFLQRVDHELARVCFWAQKNPDDWLPSGFFRLLSVTGSGAHRVGDTGGRSQFAMLRTTTTTQ